MGALVISSNYYDTTISQSLKIYNTYINNTYANKNGGILTSYSYGMIFEFNNVTTENTFSFFG